MNQLSLSVFKNFKELIKQVPVDWGSTAKTRIYPHTRAGLKTFLAIQKCLEYVGVPITSKVVEYHQESEIELSVPEVVHPLISRLEEEFISFAQSLSEEDYKI